MGDEEGDQQGQGEEEQQPPPEVEKENEEGKKEDEGVVSVHGKDDEWKKKKIRKRKRGKQGRGKEGVEVVVQAPPPLQFQDPRPLNVQYLEMEVSYSIMDVLVVSV